MLGSISGYGSDSDTEAPKSGTKVNASSVTGNGGESAAAGPSKTNASGVKAAALGIKRSAPSPKPMSPAPPEASTSRQPSVELQQDTFTSQNQESREARSEHYGSQGGQVDETSLARYGLVLPDPSLKPDPALEAKLAHFHTVSAQGHDFNSTLERNKSFRNPHILDTLVRFVSVNERGSNLPEEVWDQKNMMEQGNAKRLRAIQKQREQEREERQTKGPRRDKIAFESSSSSSNLSGRGAHRRERSRSPPPRHYDQHRHRERDRDRHRR